MRAPARRDTLLFAAARRGRFLLPSKTGKRFQDPARHRPCRSAVDGIFAVESALPRRSAEREAVPMISATGRNGTRRSVPARGCAWPAAVAVPALQWP